MLNIITSDQKIIYIVLNMNSLILILSYYSNSSALFGTGLDTISSRS